MKASGTEGSHLLRLQVKERMDIVDIPQPVDGAQYEEAVSRYAASVKGKAIAVYQLDHSRYRAACGVQLLLLTGHVGVDNRFYFSSSYRLAKRHHALFAGEPYILPAWSIRVTGYTAYFSPQLVTGRNVLEGYWPNADRDERWCRVLARYCAHAAFSSRTRRAQLLKAREVLSAAVNLRHLLVDAPAIIPETANEPYAGGIDAIFDSLFESGERTERVRAAWTLYTNAFDRFDSVMVKRLRASTSEEAVTRARARLRGEEECEDFDRAYAFRRARDIDGYFQEVASLGFAGGHLFSVAAHPRAARTPAPTPVLDTLLRSAYRVRRRLTEYAAG